MKVFIVFALVCCLSVLAVSSKWIEEDEVDTDLDTELGDFDSDEDKLALYEDILDELIAAADDNTKRPCRKNCKSCVPRCKPKTSKLTPAAWVKQCKKMRKCPPKTNY